LELLSLFCKFLLSMELSHRNIFGDTSFDTFSTRNVRSIITKHSLFITKNDFVHELVEALCYRLKDRWIKSWIRWIISICLILPAALWPWGWQPLPEMSTRKFPGAKGLPVHRADNLAAIYKPNVWKCGSLNLSQL
jgi:hypothetical protein